MWDHLSLSKTGIDPLDVPRVQSYLQQKVIKGMAGGGGRNILGGVIVG